MEIVRQSRCGFTLVELLVALAAMAMLSLMAWRGIDGMGRAQQSCCRRRRSSYRLDRSL